MLVQQQSAAVVSGAELVTEMEAAVNQGQRALHGDRQSLPSLLMVTRDLTKVLNDQYPAETETRDYLDELAMLTATPATH